MSLITALAVGVIMIISPWILGFSDISLAKWCNILLGLALVLMSAWTIFGESAQKISTAEAPQKGKRRTKLNVEQQ